MLEGSCHCGAVHWELAHTPESANACNCTICRRYGALWAYDYEHEGIRVAGRTTAYYHGDHSLGFHFCPGCGCVAYWRAKEPDDRGRHRIAVNLRLAEPTSVEHVQVNRFDGLDSFQRLPGNTRCISDLWF